jgi:tripartite-type tricarboxylate transporter receptor subunit TctC
MSTTRGENVMSRILNALVLIALLLSGMHGGGAVAASDNPQANYPRHPVRIIVPFPPGGSDVIARMLAQKLHEKLGQPFIVDNRGGAAGTLGADIASKAAADGYTLLFATASFPVTAVSYKKLPYDPIKDFAPIGFVGSVPFMLVTHPSLAAGSLKEFIALAKAQPGKLNYSSTGLGSVGHLATVLFAMQTGIAVTHVSYKGTGPAVTALLVGDVQFMMPNLIGGLSLVRAGKLKTLGVASRERSPLALDLPTLNESGLPGFDEGTWYGVMAPAGTPKRDRKSTRLNSSHPD